ncbi:MAG: magnesium transporter [Ardenticatenia bacterium]|nr:MAG: magnesium transporter [Ardenticatenia bacterium]
MPEMRMETSRVTHVRQLLRERKYRTLSVDLLRWHPADIAEVLEDLEPSERLLALRLLPDKVAGEVLAEMEESSAREILDDISPERLADILEDIQDDDAAALLEDVPDALREEVIALMEAEEAEDVRERLSYPENSAGRLMTADVVRLRRRWTVAETLDYLRHAAQTLGSVYYLYVVDDDDHLVGVVPLRALVTAAPEKTIREIMTPNVVRVNVFDDQEIVADLAAKYNFVALPVVDSEERLVGVITIDDLVDVLEEEATEDIQRLGGSEPLGTAYFATPIRTMIRKRIGWLMLLFVGGTLTGSVIRLFEDITTQFTALTIFIPLLIGTGGNAGSQTVATVIRALALGEVEFHEIFHVVLREATTASTIGLILGGIAFVRALLWHTGYEIAWVVALSLPFITVWAAIIGAMIPLVADRLGIDPTVISGPFISTSVDATGLAIYFTIARLILM